MSYYYPYSSYSAYLDSRYGYYSRYYDYPYYSRYYDYPYTSPYYSRYYDPLPLAYTPRASVVYDTPVRTLKSYDPYYDSAYWRYRYYDSPYYRSPYYYSSYYSPYRSYYSPYRYWW